MTNLEKQIINKARRLGYLFLDSGEVYEIAKNYTNSRALTLRQEIINYFEG